MTSCTFDYLTETPANKAFVACIFIYSYCIPMALTIYLYSQILGHVRSHENLLRDQVRGVSNRDKLMSQFQNLQNQTIHFLQVKN